MDNDEKFMREAIVEAKKAYAIGDIPIGAVIVYQNKIIARGFNQKEYHKIATEHAEIITIDNACKYINDWRLTGCTMYVTVEPCLMCCGAILQSRIEKLVFGISNEKFGYVKSIDNVLTSEKNNHKVNIIGGVLEDECKKLMKDFFEGKRK